MILMKGIILKTAYGFTNALRIYIISELFSFGLIFGIIICIIKSENYKEKYYVKK